MKSMKVHSTIILAAAAAVLFIGCVSAKRMLDQAESAWAAGRYAEAISSALNSYVKAVEKNKNPEDIDAARSFLEGHFDQANDNLQRQAEEQLAGSDSMKAEAWKTYRVLVEMNRSVRDSSASSFLNPRDYTADLQKAKEAAAQIKYVSALELIGKDVRSAYIEASGLLKEIDSQLVANYRDIRDLLAVCYEEGTLLIAFSSRELPMTIREGQIGSVLNYRDLVLGEVKTFIEQNDHPDFLSFTTAGSAKAASDAGAVLFVEVQGDIWISGSLEDRYYNNGTLTWERAYGGTPALIATRMSDSRSEVAPVSLDFEQSVTVEFYPQKYQTSQLTPDLFDGQFNNAGWMTSQLNEALSALKSNDSNADLTVWAEMQYGGVAAFLTEAQVPGAEGLETRTINPEVFAATESFINNRLNDFLSFDDIDVQDRLVDEMTSGFLGVSGVKDLLSNLEG